MTSERAQSSAARATLRKAATGVVEFFSLHTALATSVAMDTGARASARPLYDEALKLLRGADKLWMMGNAAAAIPLYRDAAVLFMRALLYAERREQDAQSSDPPALFGSVSAAFGHSTDPITGEALSRLRSLVGGDPVEVERLDVSENRARVSELAGAVAWFSDQVDVRTPGAIKLRRIERAFVALAVAGVLLFGGAKWAFTPTNLALHRPVRASSHAYDTQPEGAVDGIRYGQLGFHSGNDRSPWLVVDLGKVAALDEVRILGRPECCYDQSIPLALEGSKDGVTFSEIARRTEPFTQYEPWVVHPQGAQARFVRLRTLRHSFLVVGELEVYGHPL